MALGNWTQLVRKPIFFLEVTSKETEGIIKTEDIQYIVARLYRDGVAEVFPR